MARAHIVPIDMFGDVYCETVPDMQYDLITQLVGDALIATDICERRIMVLLETMEGHEKLSDRDARILLRECSDYFYRARQFLQAHRITSIAFFHCNKTQLILIV